MLIWFLPLLPFIYYTSILYVHNWEKQQTPSLRLGLEALGDQIAT